MNKILVIEYGDGNEPTEMPWDENAKRRFNFGPLELETLEDGKLVWHGKTAFELVDGEGN